MNHRNLSRALMALSMCFLIRMGHSDTFQVKTTQDSGAGSLRQAILDANARPGRTHTIEFARNLPATNGTATIKLVLALPPITVKTTLIAPSSPKVFLDGSGVSARPNGLEVRASGCVIRGLAVGKFRGCGILLAGINATDNLVQACSVGTTPDGLLAANGYNNNLRLRGGIVIADGATRNTIGGTENRWRNIISGNRRAGVMIINANANKVQGNFIGVDHSGRRALSTGGNGVHLEAASRNEVGGLREGEGNVISGNPFNGILIFSSSKNSVQGNYIGINKDGNGAVPNELNGIAVRSAFENTIQNNFISGNVANGVSIFSDEAGGSPILARKNTVLGNQIGLGKSPDKQPIALGNGLNGVAIENASLNTIGGNAPGAENKIAFSGGDGIQVARGDRNTFLGNAIWQNGGLGINLAGLENSNNVNTNDPRDADEGANNGQNSPVLLSEGLSQDGTKTVLRGVLFSTPNATFTLEFFRSDDADPSGAGEGQVPLDRITDVRTNAAGQADFSFATERQTTEVAYAATATNQDTGDTSEFSAIPVAILDFQPRSGPVGTWVVLTGVNFLPPGQSASGASPAPWRVLFNNTSTREGEVVVESATQMRVKVPQGAETGLITLTATTPGDSRKVTTRNLFTVPDDGHPLNDNLNSLSMRAADWILPRLPNGETRGTTIKATSEPNEPAIRNEPAQSSVWFAWQAQIQGPVTFQVIGDDLDERFVPVAAVYRYTKSSLVTPPPDFTDLEAIDVPSEGTGRSPRLTFQAEVDQIYVLVVDGTQGTQGSFTLRWNQQTQRPPNDFLIRAKRITGAMGSVQGSNVGAGYEAGHGNVPGEPNHANQPPRKSIWYVWSPPVGGSATFDTVASNFDTRLAIYSGPDPKIESPTFAKVAPPARAANDDSGDGRTSRVTFNATVRQTYYIVVDGAVRAGGQAAEGLVVLNWQLSNQRGTTVRWKDPVNGNWSDGSKWNIGRPPGTDDHAFIDVAGNYEVKLDVNTSVAALTLGSGTTSSTTERQTLRMTSHRLTLNGSGAIEGSGLLLLRSGSLITNENLTIGDSATMQWSGGTLRGKGVRFVNLGGTLIIDGDALKYLAQGGVMNLGLTVWRDKGLLKGGRDTHFDNYGTFQVENDATFGWDGVGGKPGFNNSERATFLKTRVRTGDATRFEDVGFHNDGLVRLLGNTTSGGTLSLQGGGVAYGKFFLDAGTHIDFGDRYVFDKTISTLIGGGFARISTGAVAVEAPVEARNVELRTQASPEGELKGVLEGADRLSVSGELRWVGGTMRGTGTTLVGEPVTGGNGNGGNDDAKLRLLGSEPKTLTQRRLVNRGKALWIGQGDIFAGEGSVMDNNGEFLTRKSTTVTDRATIDYSGTGEPFFLQNRGFLGLGDASDEASPPPPAGASRAGASRAGASRAGASRAGASQSPVGRFSGLSFSIGLLRIYGGFNHESVGILKFDIAGPARGQFDHLEILPDSKVAPEFANRNGLLRIEPGGELWVSFKESPQLGDEFPIITYGKLQGNFEDSAIIVDPEGAQLKRGLGLKVIDHPGDHQLWLTVVQLFSTLQVKGRVHEANGKGVPNVQIQLHQRADGTLIDTVSTNNSGEYVLRDVEPDDYTVTPELTDWTFDPSQHEITVRGRDVEHKDFIGTTSHSTISIGGRVADSTGTGLKNVSMKLLGPNGELIDERDTGMGGNYRFLDVLPGEYTLVPMRQDVTFDPPARKVEVKDESEAVEAFTALFPLSGRIVNTEGGGVSGVRVELDNGQIQTTDADGNYRFKGLVVGRRYIATPRSNVYGFEPSKQSRTVTNPDTVTNPETSLPDFLALRAPAIGGYIEDRDGRPMPNVTVRLFARQALVAEAATNTKGFYSFEKLAPGTYAVAPVRNGFVFSPPWDESVTLGVAPAFEKLATFTGTPLIASAQSLPELHAPQGTKNGGG